MDRRHAGTGRRRPGRRRRDRTRCRRPSRSRKPPARKRGDDATHVSLVVYDDLQPATRRCRPTVEPFLTALATMQPFVRLEDRLEHRIALPSQLAVLVEDVAPATEAEDDPAAAGSDRLPP